jgi:uncharacterized protein YggE
MGAMMRMIRMMGFWAALLSAPVGVSAQAVSVRVRSAAPVAASAPGEVVLSVRGSGLQVSVPDFASLSVMITIGGENNIAARDANQALRRKTLTILKAAGVEDSVIQPLSSNAMSTTGMDNEAYAMLGTKAPKSMAMSSMVIRFTDMAKLRKVREALQEIMEIRVGATEYGLVDNSNARRAALDQALAKARIDAALYAKALNMRVDRIARVSDGANGWNGAYLAELVAAQGRVPAEGVQTEARVEVDFILKPL